MIGRRSLALIALAVPLALAGLSAAYVKVELADSESFAERAVDALRSEEVRTVIAEQVAVEMIERGSPDLVAERPVVLTAVEALLETERFARVLRRTAASVHELLLRGDRDVIVELEAATDVLVPAVRSVSPEVARQIPSNLRPRIAEIRGSHAATWVVRVADGASAAALPLLLGAVGILALAVTLAPDRRRALAAAGVALAAGAAGGLIAMVALRAQVLSNAEQIGVLSEDDARAAAGAAWDALAGGLEWWLLVMGIAGLAVLGGALVAEARVDRRAALRTAADVVAGGRLPPATRLLRGLTLAGLGALILLRAEPVLAVAIVVLGAVLVLLGLAEALSTAGGPPGSVRRFRRPSRRTIAVAGAAALATAVAVAVILLVRGGPPAPPGEAEVTACNGLPALCDRRLDQVVLPGTHNSMAAANRPGWFFAGQFRSIPRQLRDGIRFLMIDVHYAVVNARGRVRTDLSAEGTNRNRVANAIGGDAVEAAERLAGRLGLVPAEGERELFLCHTLCELGAERMSATLDAIRGFLERNRSEVLVVFVESSVEPREVEREFEEADLEPYLATLRRGAPLPTLRELIASGRRLIVLDQGDGGPASWYQPAFVFIQDTRIGSSTSRGECVPNRGTPESPLVLLNHWTERFPPSPVQSAKVNTRAALLKRVRTCRERLGRAPNLIAVDFYTRGDLIAVAEELNRGGTK